MPLLSQEENPAYESVNSAGGGRSLPPPPTAPKPGGGKHKPKVSEGQGWEGEKKREEVGR